MTNPFEPNDLSHLSDEQFRALCPLGEHAPGPEPLSPAAQAVLDAAYAGNAEGDVIGAAAAALRTAADQVVPEMQEPDWGSCVDMHCDIELYTDHQRKRSTLLAIAAELEGADQSTSSTH